MLVWAVWCYPDTCLELLKVIWSWAVFPDVASNAHTQYPANSKRTLTCPSPPTVRLHEPVLPANRSVYSSADVGQRIVILRTDPSTQAAASSTSHPMEPTSPGANSTPSTAYAQYPANSKRTMTCPLPPTFRLHEPVLPANRSFYS